LRELRQKEHNTHLVVLPDLPYKRTKRLININSLFGRRLDEFASKMFGKVTAFVHPDLTLVLQITLVSDNDNGESVLILDPKDLLVESADFFKRIARGDGVDEKETFSCAHILFTHGSGMSDLLVRKTKEKRVRDSPVFLLTSGIEDVQ
jgi:hypothetical protein